MGRNKFANQLDSAKAKGFMLGQHFTRQLALDLTGIILNHEFGFGAERLQKFNKLLIDLYGEFADIWNGDTKDVEYSKAYIDRALKQIYGDKFEDWETRYS